MLLTTNFQGKIDRGLVAHAGIQALPPEERAAQYAAGVNDAHQPSEAERNLKQAIAAAPVVGDNGSVEGVAIVDAAKEKVKLDEKKKKDAEKIVANALETQRQEMMERLAREIEFYEGEFDKAKANRDAAQSKKDDLEPLHVLLQSGQYDTHNEEHRAMAQQNGFDPDDAALKDKVEEEYGALHDEVEYWSGKMDGYQAILDEKRAQLKELEENPNMSVEDMSALQREVDRQIGVIRSDMERDISKLPADIQTGIFMKKMAEMEQASDPLIKERLRDEVKELGRNVSDEVRGDLEQIPEVQSALTDQQATPEQPEASSLVAPQEQNQTVQAALSF